MKFYNKSRFQEHLTNDHNLTVWTDNFKEIIYGGTDGIVTTFTVVAGFTGASLNGGLDLKFSIVTVLLFGFANLFADGASMGVGNYLSLRAEQRYYLDQRCKEKYEIETNPDDEQEETIYLLEERGFSRNDAEDMTRLLMKYPDYWLDFMMTEELGLQDTSLTNPIINGCITFASFCIFGAIPLIPYLLPFTNSFYVFCFSGASTLFALIILGVFNAKISKRHPAVTILETVILGGIATVIAYIVGTLFR